MRQNGGDMPHGPQLLRFYEVIAPFYDLDHADLHKQADIRFFIEHGKRANGTVLELGCGTGRVLLPMAKAGIPVHGVDISQPMLDRFQQALAQEPQEVRDRVTLTCADVLQLDLGRTFPLVISAGHVMHSFLDRKCQRAFLRTAHRHIGPSGSFLFDPFQPDFRIICQDWEEPTIDVDRTDPQTGERTRRFLFVHQEVPFQKYRVDMRWVVESSRGEVLNETSASIWQRWFTHGELECLLELEGMRIAECWGDWDGQPWDCRARQQLIRAEPLL